MIEFINVGKTYPNGFTALSNINLTIKQGEFVAIIGLSGAGKSTLLRTINRMHDVTQGQLLVDYTDISIYKGKALRSYRHSIGMVFQSFNLVDKTTAFNNVLVANVYKMNAFKTLFKLYSKQDKILALESLEKVGILDKAFVRADHLSGGQRQRVALARTLAQEAKIILADEPIASLDPISAETAMKDFRRINKDYNITVIANMHHVDMAIKYADRVIGINSGEIVFDGESSKVTSEVLKAIYGRDLTEDDILEDLNV